MTREFWERTGMVQPPNEWLIDPGVSVMGIDQWGWDAPLQHYFANPSSKAAGAPSGRSTALTSARPTGTWSILPGNS